MCSLRSRRGRVQVSLGGKEFLHQAVDWGKEDGVAGFHQPVPQGAQGVGLAGAGQSEGQDVDAVLHETALGQMVQLLAQRQGHPVVLEGLPGLTQRQPGFPKQPEDASLAAVLGFLLQHLKQGGKGVAVGFAVVLGRTILGTFAGYQPAVDELP